jgi:cobalt-zinc-cadmium efflux system membrane fusion protein
MLRRLRHSTAVALSWLPTLLIFAILGAVAGAGFWFDWKIPPASKLWGSAAVSDQENTKEAVKVIAPSSGAVSAEGESASMLDGARIEFPSANAVRKVGIQTMLAQPRPMAQQVVATGEVDFDPSHYARLSSRVSGTIWRVEKEIGDKVRKGDVLVLIDSAEVGQAKAEFLQDLAQVEVRKQTLEGLQSAASSGAVSDRSVREATTALREARIRLLNDQQRLLNLGLPLRMEEIDKLSEERLARYLRLLGLPDYLRKEVDPETFTANLLPLNAPFDGRVVERNVGPGEFEQTTSPKVLFIVGDEHHLHFDLDVNPEDVKEVRVGQPVRFAPDGKGMVGIVAHVSHLSPEVDEKTRRVRVHAEAEDPQGQLRPHTFGTGYILVREKPDALAVPSEALQSDSKSQFVFIRLSPTRFQVRSVQPGLRDGSFVEVVGVHAGEEVVTIGSFVLKSELLREKIAGDE